MFSISTPLNLFLCGTQFCSVMCYLNALPHFLSVCKQASWRDQCEDHSQVFLKEVTNLTKVNEFNKYSMIQSSRILRYTIHIRACEWLNLYPTILHMRLIYNMVEKKAIKWGAPGNGNWFDSVIIFTLWTYAQNKLHGTKYNLISLVNGQKSLVYVPAMNMFQYTNRVRSHSYWIGGFRENCSKFWSNLPWRYFLLRGQSGCGCIFTTGSPDSHCKHWWTASKITSILPAGSRWPCTMASLAWNSHSHPIRSALTTMGLPFSNILLVVIRMGSYIFGLLG